MIAALWKTHWKQSLGLFMGSWLFFLMGVSQPTAQVYDEFHYVPASKNLVKTWTNTNWEHPPLAKWIMGFGIELGGDHSWGWRWMSTLFGALTVWGMYAWGMTLFRKKSIALWVALVSLFNFMLYVQARIGMLDTFMVAFMVWGWAAWTHWIQRSISIEEPAHSSSSAWRIALFGGVCFGLATACKWFAIVPWFFCLGAAVALRPLRLAKVPWAQWWVAGWLVPSLFYALTYLPQLHEAQSLGDAIEKWLSIHREMYSGQLRVVDSHNYMSSWTSWPWMTRPIWYAFEREGTDWARCILMMGNPAVIWGGLAAVLFLLVDFFSRPLRFVPVWITLSYGAVYLCWAVIPRKVAFFYYYYPAALVLGLALAQVFYSREKSGTPQRMRPSFWFLALTFLFFIYFFPILSGIRIHPEAFRHWMWFRSWI